MYFCHPKPGNDLRFTAYKYSTVHIGRFHQLAKTSRTNPRQSNCWTQVTFRAYRRILYKPAICWCSPAVHIQKGTGQSEWGSYSCRSYYTGESGRKEPCHAHLEHTHTHTHITTITSDAKKQFFYRKLKTVIFKMHRLKKQFYIDF